MTKMYIVEYKNSPKARTIHTARRFAVNDIENDIETTFNLYIRSQEARAVIVRFRMMTDAETEGLLNRGERVEF